MSLLRRGRRTSALPRVRVWVPIALISIGLSTCVSAPSAAQSEGCVNESIRLEQAYGERLPDCRAYEQVSPADKNLSSAIGHAGLTQISPDGERVTYGSIVPFPNTPGSSEYPTYLSTRARGGSGWLTQGLLPPTPGAEGEESAPSVVVSGMTEDLSDGVIGGFAGYLYDTESHLLSPFPIANEGFVDASADDSTVLLASSQPLPVLDGPTGIEGDPNLYEWRAGQLRLVAADAVAGPDVEAPRRPNTYTEDSISTGGERVFYTSPAAGASEGRIYMRESLGQPIAISNGTAELRAATRDGSNVVYTEGTPTGEGITGGLYRWRWRPGEAAPHTAEIAEPSAEVLGTLGISSDGSYVYFVAEGKLGAGGPGGEPVAGKPNLYLWHEGAAEPIVYIATLTFLGSDPDNWRDYFDHSLVEHPAEGLRSAQVTPDGMSLLFTSILPLTHYPNQEHSEIYLYNASSALLTCVSCNPSGEPAHVNAYLWHQPIKYAAEPSGRNRPYALHNLSNDGRRVFFQTSERLLSNAENGLANVYEWESGHLYLLSTGQGAGSAYLGGASADGSDVFFFTAQPLVAQDRDENIDLYDARENGGIANQNETLQAECGEQCRGEESTAPAFGVPASYTFAGPSNATATVAPSGKMPVEAKAKSKPKSKPKCKRGYRRNKRGRCVHTKAARRRGR